MDPRLFLVTVYWSFSCSRANHEKPFRRVVYLIRTLSVCLWISIFSSFQIIWKCTFSNLFTGGSRINDFVLGGFAIYEFFKGILDLKAQFSQKQSLKFSKFVHTFTEETQHFVALALSENLVTKMGFNSKTQQSLNFISLQFKDLCFN